jgi:hypothetical protein
MSIQIHTQPIPEHVAEACAWLWAAERCASPGCRVACAIAPPRPRH